MKEGLCFTYKAAAYPRYRFYQQHLKRLVERWLTILDAGGLPDSISQGRTKLKEITALAYRIDDSVTVNVFADTEFLETHLSEVPLQCDQEITGSAKNVTWDDFSRETRPSNDPTVTVIVLATQQEHLIKDVTNRLSHLPKDELCNFIVYFAKTKTSIPFNDLDMTELQQLHVDRSTEKPDIPHLNKQIQNVLEEKAISVFDRIAAYNKVFIPKKQEDDDQSLEDTIHMKLSASLRNSYIVKDLSPEGNNKIDETERKLTDQELSRIVDAVGSEWEMLAPSLGLTQTRVDEIKQSHEDRRSQVYSMLALWRQKEGSTQKYLLTLLQNASSVMTVDMHIIKEIEETALAPKTDSEKDTLFHKKLLEFVLKKTKCVTCEKLSLKYGISSSLINEFLNNGFFGYEKRVGEVMSSMSLPSWPSDKSEIKSSTYRHFAYSCATNMAKMIRETENYIKVKHSILVVLGRLQFQLFGLLDQTNAVFETKIPEIPKLPLELQHALLDIQEVFGCGTVWGELVIHVTKKFFPFKKEEIKRLLSKYTYMNGYTTEVIESESEISGGYSHIEHGSSIRAKRLNSDSLGEDRRYRYGSLGCFVHVKPQSGQTDSANYELHGITCAHCVDDCDTNIEIKHEEKYIVFGQKKHYIYEPHSIDVAMVEIDQSKANMCEKTLKNGFQSCTRKWQFHEEAPVKTPVYKYGCATGLTFGTCVSNDYQTKQMMINWNEKLKAEKIQLNPDFNILIRREDIQENLPVIKVEPKARPTAEESESDQMECENKGFQKNLPVIKVEPKAKPTEESESDQMECENKGFQENLPVKKVEPKAKPTEESESDQMECENKATLFSQEGDSGSVVCMDGPANADTVHVISLLMGSVKQVNGESYSYSSHLHKTVEKLQTQCNCIIEPAIGEELCASRT